jgi:hypothetical protein
MVDERRRTVRPPEEPMELPRLALVAGGSATVEQEVLARVGGTQTLAIFDSLTEDQRAVVLLRILMDLPSPRWPRSSTNAREP